MIHRWRQEFQTNLPLLFTDKRNPKGKHKLKGTSQANRLTDRGLRDAELAGQFALRLERLAQGSPDEVSHVPSENDLDLPVGERAGSSDRADLHQHTARHDFAGPEKPVTGACGRAGYRASHIRYVHVPRTSTRTPR